MSRSVDQGTAESKMASDAQAAYADIVDALSPNTSELLDIELLGKSYPLPPGCNVLLHGTSIGVPKLKLVQAFVVARRLFFNCLEEFHEARFQDIRNATAVILLMDPEHITAANARKRIIQHLRKGSNAEVQSLVEKELLAIDSLLISRLNRHTKSPTLWGHRRWLLGILKALKLQHDVQRDVEAVVLVAAERHPRNYYAWLHLRWLLQSFHGLRDSPATEYSKMLSFVKEWCLRHPADTSGWSFLLSYLFSAEFARSAWIETNSSVCKEVFGLAVPFRWTHESIWVFLRTLVASGNIQEDQRSLFFKTVESLTREVEDPKARKILQVSHDWCVNYSV